MSMRPGFPSDDEPQARDPYADDLDDEALPLKPELPSPAELQDDDFDDFDDEFDDDFEEELEDEYDFEEPEDFTEEIFAGDDLDDTELAGDLVGEFDEADADTVVPYKHGGEEDEETLEDEA
jgi:hypothetical protein